MNSHKQIDWPNRAVKHRGKSPLRRPIIAALTTICLLTLLIAVWTASAIASRAHRNAVPDRARVATEPAIGSLAPQPGASGKAAGPLQAPTLTESVLLTITPRGFEPTEITVVPGPFFLVVENRSGVPQMSLRVNQAGGFLVKSADVGEEMVDWADLFDLSPGSYVLSETGHPGKFCNLTVKAN